MNIILPGKVEIDIRSFVRFFDIQDIHITKFILTHVPQITTDIR